MFVTALLTSMITRLDSRATSTQTSSAEHVSGQVHLDVPNVIRDSEEKSSNVRARIGAGGTPITISSVSGNIRLTRS